MTINDLIRSEEESAVQGARQDNILDVLEARFGTVPNVVCVRVMRTTDSTRLRQLHRLAVMEPSLDHFLTKLYRSFSIADLVTPLEEIAMEEVHQQDILDALEMRFGSVAEDVCARVKQIEGPDRLRHLHRLAVVEPSLEQFLAKL